LNYVPLESCLFEHIFKSVVGLHQFLIDRQQFLILPLQLSILLSFIMLRIDNLLLKLPQFNLSHSHLLIQLIDFPHMMIVDAFLYVSIRTGE